MGRHARFLDLALRLATDSSCRQKHGAIVVKSGKVVARATNRPRNDPAVIQRPLCQSIHAEVRALAQVARPSGSTVYVARVRFDGSPAMSEPCEACWEALRSAGVRNVVWTTD